MNKKVKYALRIAKECLKKKPLDIKLAKIECVLNDVKEALISNE